MNDTNERSCASRGSESLLCPKRLAHFRRQYARLTYGAHERKMISIRRKSKWRLALKLPSLWLGHFRVAARYTSTRRAARLATLFVMSMWAGGVC